MKRSNSIQSVWLKRTLDSALFYNDCLKEKAAAEYEEFLKKKPDYPDGKKLRNEILSASPVTFRSLAPFTFEFSLHAARAMSDLPASGGSHPDW